MNGFEACRKIREKPEFKKTNIIAQTGSGDDETIEECINAGFNEHILKPMALSSVKKIINPN